jgi:hypothetical protein
MGIQNKIDKIRRKPEHIRMRYAWGFAVGGTFLVVIIWGFSLVAQKNEGSLGILSGDQMQSLENIKDQGVDLKNSAADLKNSIETVPPQKAESQLNIDDRLTQQADQNAANDSTLDPTQLSDPSSDPSSLDNTDYTSDNTVSGDDTTSSVSGSAAGEGFGNN